MGAIFNILAGMMTVGIVWLGNVSMTYVEGRENVQKVEEYDTQGLLAVIKANEAARPVVLTTAQQHAILKDLWEGGQ